MPLIRHFQSTSITKAFILNSLASALVIVFALTLKQVLDNTFQSHTTEENKTKVSFSSVAITFALTFVASLLAYTALYYLFGFGGGMLSQAR